jgi:hypothetical protein
VLQFWSEQLSVGLNTKKFGTAASKLSCKWSVHDVLNLAYPLLIYWDRYIHSMAEYILETCTTKRLYFGQKKMGKKGNGELYGCRLGYLSICFTSALQDLCM